MESKYTRCPNCKRKTVYWRGMPNGEDNYQCRMSDCDFFFFTMGDSKSDRENEKRWNDLNQEKAK